MVDKYKYLSALQKRPTTASDPIRSRSRSDYGYFIRTGVAGMDPVGSSHRLDIRMSRLTWRQAADVSLVLCVLALTGMTAYRTFVPQTREATRVKVENPGMYFSRQRVLTQGGGGVGIVVWTDYECPACVMFEGAVDSALHSVSGGLRVYYQPFPNRAGHPRGYQAALFAECAAGQGRFSDAHRALFALRLPERRDFPSDSLARALQLDRTPAFAECMASAGTSQLIDSLVQAGLTAGVAGTPSVLIGSEIRLGGLPAPDLITAVEAAR